MFLDFLAALVLAFLFVLLLIGAFGWGRYEGRGFGWGAVAFVFFILLLAIWAGSLWVPVGPVAWGVAWVPLFFIGLFLIFLFAAAVPPARWRRPRRVAGTTEEAAVESAGLAFGLFFWLMMVLLIVALFAGYAHPPYPG